MSEEKKRDEEKQIPNKREWVEYREEIPFRKEQVRESEMPSRDRDDEASSTGPRMHNTDQE